MLVQVEPSQGHADAELALLCHLLPTAFIHHRRHHYVRIQFSAIYIALNILLLFFRHFTSTDVISTAPMTQLYAWCRLT